MTPPAWNTRWLTTNWPRTWPSLTPTWWWACRNPCAPSVVSTPWLTPWKPMFPYWPTSTPTVRHCKPWNCWRTTCPPATRTVPTTRSPARRCTTLPPSPVSRSPTPSWVCATPWPTNWAPSSTFRTAWPTPCWSATSSATTRTTTRPSRPRSPSTTVRRLVVATPKWLTTWVWPPPVTVPPPRSRSCWPGWTSWKRP